MGVSGYAGSGIKELMRGGLGKLGPMGLAGLILGGKTILDEMRNPGSQPGYDVPVAKKRSDQNKPEKKE